MLAQERHLYTLLGLIKDYKNIDGEFGKTDPAYAFKEKNRIAEKFNQIKNMPICPLPVSNAKPASPEAIKEVMGMMNVVSIAEDHHKQN